MKDNNKKSGAKKTTPSFDELMLMEANPLPPAYEQSKAKEQPEPEPIGEREENTSEEVNQEKVVEPKKTVNTGNEQQDLIKSSPFISRLKAYDDEYQKRLKVVDRKTVMIDTDVQDAVESLNLNMSKQNIINAMLTACIEEHSEDLRKFKKKNTLL